MSSITCNNAYLAFKAEFDLRDRPLLKLVTSLPILSSLDAIYCYHEARKGVRYALTGDPLKLNYNERIAIIIKSTFGLIPGANLALYPILGLATIACIAVDSVRKKLDKTASEA